jgi:H+/Cl- antiporter ClcA
MKFYGIEALLLVAVVAGLLAVVAGFQFLFASGQGKVSYQRAPFWGLLAAAIPFGVAVAGLYLAQAYRPWVDAAGIPAALAGAAAGYWLYQKKGGASPPPPGQG